MHNMNHTMTMSLEELTELAESREFKNEVPIPAQRIAILRRIAHLQAMATAEPEVAEKEVSELPAQSEVADSGVDLGIEGNTGEVGDPGVEGVDGSDVVLGGGDGEVEFTQDSDADCLKDAPVGESDDIEATEDAPAAE